MFPPNIWGCKFTDNSSIYKAECEQIHHFSDGENPQVRNGAVVLSGGLPVAQNSPGGRERAQTGKAQQVRPCVRQRAALQDDGAVVLSGGLPVAQNSPGGRERAQTGKAQQVRPRVRQRAALQDNRAHRVGEVAQRIGIGDRPRPSRH